MNYEMFKEVVAVEFENYLPDEYKEAGISIRPFEKINGTKDGIVMNHAPEDGVAPIMYVNDLFSKYEESQNLQAVFQSAATQFMQCMEKREDIKQNINWNTMKENIVYQLINTEQNKEFLSNIPHREFQDLSVIYRWVMGLKPEGMESAVITDTMIDGKFTEEELFQYAQENTKRILPTQMCSMEEMIREMFGQSGEESIVDEMIEDFDPQNAMWVVSNKGKMYGATAILQEEVLQKLSQKFQGDLYILPSSLHETIVVSAEGKDPYELAEMVAEINMSQVELEDRLSNQVYHYDKDLRTISMATDTPVKRLDGQVAEPDMSYGSKETSR